jgi:hypothetical protein
LSNLSLEAAGKTLHLLKHSSKPQGGSKTRVKHEVGTDIRTFYRVPDANIIHEEEKEPAYPTSARKTQTEDGELRFTTEKQQFDI